MEHATHKQPTEIVDFILARAGLDASTGAKFRPILDMWATGGADITRLYWFADFARQAGAEPWKQKGWSHIIVAAETL